MSMERIYKRAKSKMVDIMADDEAFIKYKEANNLSNEDFFKLFGRYLLGYPTKISLKRQLSIYMPSENRDLFVRALVGLSSLHVQKKVDTKIFKEGSSLSFNYYLERSANKDDLLYKAIKIRSSQLFGGNTSKYIQDVIMLEFNNAGIIDSSGKYNLTVIAAIEKKAECIPDENNKKFKGGTHTFITHLVIVNLKEVPPPLMDAKGNFKIPATK